MLAVMVGHLGPGLVGSDIDDFSLLRAPTARVGQCLVDVPSGPPSAEQVGVRCDRTHAAQVVVTFELSSGDYPSDAIEAGAGRGCRERLPVDLARRVQNGELSLHLLHPTAEPKPAKPAVACIVARASGEPLTEDLTHR